MNLFWREMKAHRKALIIWSIGAIFMVASGMGKYAGLSSNGGSINDLMADMPKSMQVIMGTGTFDLSKASGYYGLLYIYLLMITTIHSVLIGSNIIAKEERDKTSEFLFVKPISRRKIITSKLIAAFVNIVVINLITFISSILFVNKYSNGEDGISGKITILMIGMFIVQLLFMIVGSSLAALLKNPKRSATISTGILLVTFILSITIDINEKLGFLRCLTPFKYFDAKSMYDSGFDLVYVILSVALIVSLTVVTYVFFQKRDLKI